MPKTLSNQRFLITQFLVLTLFCVVIYQLVQLTIIRRDTLVQIANKQHILTIENSPVRGEILDKNRKELATNLKVPSVYSVPRMLGKAEKQTMATKVSHILGIDYSYTLERLTRDKAFVWLRRRVASDQAEKIRDLQSPSLGIVDESKRFYPQADLLSQIIGFANVDNMGMEGIELYANRELEGRAGERVTKRDALGRQIRAFDIKSIPKVDGNKVILTIDQYIQYLTERALDRAYTKWKAKAGWAIVMDVHTGEIYAMANRPSYDPNRYQDAKPEERRNRAVTDVYEPGSIFKIVATSAALNEGLTTTSSLFDCENGEYRYGSKTLHDVHPYGDLTFEEVLIKSSNIGTVKIAALLKPEVFQSYIEGFGFGKKTGIDLPGEVSGFTNPPAKWSKTSPYNIPIGHEILVTALQMVTAMSVIANGGELVEPYIISRVEDQSGVLIQEKNPHIKRRVLRKEVADAMRGILKRVVDEGTGKNARIKGMGVGGKTGTAQKVLPNGGGYSHDDFMSSFVGFAPAENPRLAMVVTLDDPGPKYYGGTVAAPVFQEVMEAALLSLGYVPQEEAVKP